MIQVLNIPDAYLDSRFNRDVDQQTGYHTQSILCMAIFIQKEVIGVMEMVNKHHGTFTADDEESFELFVVYCGLALHHAKLYDRIRVSELKYRVTLEVLSYHNCCTDKEYSNTSWRPTIDAKRTERPRQPGIRSRRFSSRRRPSASISSGSARSASTTWTKSAVPSSCSSTYSD